jgi:hydrogenase maturation protein HypF
VTARGYEAIEWIGQRVREGFIAAIKGVGGYQLVCDATNDSVVQRLRERKHRPTKPLPIMVGDVSQAQAFAITSDAERAALEARSNPIVLLRSRHHERLAASIHPRLADIGVMLPTSPLHSLLLAVVDRPVVITSGNSHGSPLVFQWSVDERSRAEGSLSTIADVWLHHNRTIVRPVDDSVVRVVGDQVLTIRCARGLAPLTINVPNHEEIGSSDLIGVGGHQKVAIGLATREHLVLAPHLGDMESECVRKRFMDEFERFTSLYEVENADFAVDMHPGYYTRRYALGIDQESMPVQHHHAHVAAAMLNHGLEQQQVLGFAFDGTGYGVDGTAWGGEVLVCGKTAAKRVAHLRTFRLPGGEVAIKQPWRVAISLLSQCVDESVQAEWLCRFGQTITGNAFDYALAQGAVCSSMGRLFDAIAAMVFPREKFHYEGEAAMVLESACDVGESSHYSFALEAIDPIVIDWRPVVRAVASDVEVLSAGVIAMKFHRGVAMMMVEIAHRYESLVPVVCGGVFQNRELLTLLLDMNAKLAKPFRMPGRVPVNDGGLALGQLVIARASERLAARRKREQVQRCV